MAKAKTLVLAYSGCGTCKKALKWLGANEIAYEVRPIVEEPPTEAELAQWIPASGRPIKKWLNTSGQSYRALGKEAFDVASDGDIARMLAADGKLVKRPVLVHGRKVLVGFDEDEYKALLTSA